MNTPEQLLEPSQLEDGTGADGTRLVHITTVPMSLTFLRGQLGYMKRRGMAVHAISSPGEDLDRFGRDEGVEVHAVEMARRLTPLRDLVAVARIFRVLRRIRPQIVHAHTPKGGLLGMIAAGLFKAPIRVYHIRGLPLMGTSGWKRRLLWTTEWISCRIAHQVLCVSHSVHDEAVRTGICSPRKIKVLHRGSGNGVDSSVKFNPAVQSETARVEMRQRLAIPDDAYVIGFVGRLVRDKGVVELAEAWRQVRGTLPGAHLLLVGPFEEQDPIPRQTMDFLQADPRVHLAGMDWNTPAYYAAMDVVTLPTYREGFPNVPLEAAAMGLPVVATLIPGCIDAVVNGATGTLVPPRDADALAAALLRYGSERELGHRHGRAGQTRVRSDFRPETIWKALHAEYLSLLARRGGKDRPKALPPGGGAARAAPPRVSRRRWGQNGAEQEGAPIVAGRSSCKQP